MALCKNRGKKMSKVPLLLPSSSQGEGSHFICKCWWPSLCFNPYLYKPAKAGKWLHHVSLKLEPGENVKGDLPAYRAVVPFLSTPWWQIKEWGLGDSVSLLLTRCCSLGWRERVAMRSSVELLLYKCSVIWSLQIKSFLSVRKCIQFAVT